MKYFILELPLNTEKYQEDVLDKRFNIGLKMYNALVNITKKKYEEMKKTRYYRQLISSLTHDTKIDKHIYKELGNLRKIYGLTEYDFHKDISPMQKHFKKNIDSFTAQKIASRLWKSFDDLFFGKGDEIHYKKFQDFNSLEGKSNKTGIRYKDEKLVWNGLTIKVEIDKNNPYEVESLYNEIAYCRVVRKYIRSRVKYYIQLVLKGIPPRKRDKNTGLFRRSIGNGDVGLDIGTSTIAIVSESEVKLLELANKVQSIENSKRVLLRKMDRSKRAMNPSNYNEDGTIKKQGNKKVKWVFSNHYKKLVLEVRELYRKQAAIRKYQHECLSNFIISLGDKIYVEQMNFNGLQKRSNKTEKNEKGKFKKKKRFGRTIANRAPAMLLSMIDIKLSYYDKRLIKINTVDAKASQYNHFDGSYTKKKLSERWNDFNGIRVQRDLYSAFLIMNIDKDLKTFNSNKCKTRFNRFYENHEKEIERLLCSSRKNLKSMGI